MPPLADSPQRDTFVHGHVIGLVAFYQILRIFLRRSDCIVLKLRRRRDLFFDPSLHPTGFRIPAYMISDSKFPFHHTGTEALFGEAV